MAKGFIPFQSVKELRPGRSVFDLSNVHKLTCDMGQLIPIMCEEVVPGDLWDIGNEIVARCLALVAPIMHEVNVTVHYYFEPYRILWSDWENFITGGPQGTDVSVLPRWVPTNVAEGSLWDYLGFPTSVIPPGLSAPIDFPRRAYNDIYNKYYRDETLVPEVALTNEAILNRAWEKDYLTSALPWQQRGTAPALPISGTTHAVWTESGLITPSAATTPWQLNVESAGGGGGQNRLRGVAAGSVASLNTLGAFNNNVVDLSSATTFNVADLRLVFQIQKWLERNARSGARYTEFLRAHFGVSPRDDRLQRPEYIGGSKSPLIISEVLQTSQTGTTPQGNMAGHGITADRQYVARYHAQEYGLIMGIMSIMPRTAYQQGINRQWLRRTKYDFYSPEFSHLSEQAIELEEVYAGTVEATNRSVFGYQGHWDEMRYKPNTVHGQMRSTFNYWHLGRIFGSAPALNAAFITSNPTKRIFADQDDPGLMVSFGNLIRAARPMPIESDPGLIDH